METEQINSTLTEIFRKTFKSETLDLSNSLTASDVDGWDSLTHMILITEIENTFGLKFKLKDLNKMKNVGVLIDIIQSKL
ncbi:acyl carrier protein [Winogradskyella poriferorum]|uniref:acyl carrier protein n=1 Tax=Winogradskyella poriferorum TaxID=307627 RepID=UPI003D647A6D